MIRSFILGTFVALSSLPFYQHVDAKDDAPGVNEKALSPRNGSARFCTSCQGIDIFTDLLVWCAQESGSENWGQIYSPDTPKETIDILDVSFDWEPGFRLGIGYGLKHTLWDTQLYYTWFHTQGKDHHRSNDQIASAFLGNFYIYNEDGSKDAGPTYHGASIKWAIGFNVLDWELGREFCASKALTLRPFIGLKGGWIHQTIHTKWQEPIFSGVLPFSPPIPFNTARENIKNNFWGLGPSIGLNTKWRLCALDWHSFDLFGNFSGAIMWGHWTFKDVYKNDSSQKVSTHLPNINGAAYTARAFLGFEWDAIFDRGQFCFSIQLGYEAQFWLDQLQFYSFNAGRLDNLLTLQGGSLDFRFDF